MVCGKAVMRSDQCLTLGHAGRRACTSLPSTTICGVYYQTQLYNYNATFICLPDTSLTGRLIIVKILSIPISSEGRREEERGGCAQRVGEAKRGVRASVVRNRL